jgi:hypothetical protein
VKLLGHFVQLLAPVTPEYVPAGQDTHALAPVTFLYWPTAHAEHWPPFGPVYPASQAQYSCETLPAADVAFAWHCWHEDAPDTPENVLFGQTVHLVAPITFEYAPAEQFVHGGVPAAPYFPASHITGHVYVSK